MVVPTSDEDYSALFPYPGQQKSHGWAKGQKALLRQPDPLAGHRTEMCSIKTGLCLANSNRHFPPFHITALRSKAECGLTKIANKNINNWAAHN